MRLEALPRRQLVRAALLGGLLIACVGVFISLLQLTAAGATDAFDRAVVTWVAARRTPSLTAIAADLTALGSRTLLTISTAIVFALLWTSGRRLAALDTALACTAAGVITRVLKIVLGRPRPTVAEQLVSVAGYSFPSGHSSGITALLTATALHTIEVATTRAQRVVLGIFYAVLILGVGWSRIYLGVHYPTDVVAGICVGVACGLAAHGLVRTRAIVRQIRALLR
jgi:undecaprenyl-diphosphatase